MTLLTAFFLFSFLAALIVVAACVRSAKISRWENLPERYPNAGSVTSAAPATKGI